MLLQVLSGVPEKSTCHACDAAVGAESRRLHYAMTANQLGADTTWITADIYLWAAIENSVGLICACMPTFGPIISTTKQALSSYASELSLWRGSGSLPRTSSSDQPHARWVTIGGTVHGEAVQPSTSTASLRPRYPRTDDISLHNYHDPTKPTGNGMAA
ncbi:hypothetical protein GGS20DRAFT_587482 [Poronia punctata]|nr:hypothetical protein GGS20DRAFT_587482 [Poronia punctata]